MAKATLHELPAEAAVHPKIVVSSSSGNALTTRIGSRRSPTKELRRLMNGSDQSPPVGR
jgi:hypothetical protein